MAYFYVPPAFLSTSLEGFTTTCGLLPPGVNYPVVMRSLAGLAGLLCISQCLWSLSLPRSADQPLWGLTSQTRENHHVSVLKSSWVLKMLMCTTVNVGYISPSITQQTTAAQFYNGLMELICNSRGKARTVGDMRICLLSAERTPETSSAPERF